MRSRSHPAGMKLVIGFIYVLGGFLVLLGLLSGGEGPSVVIPVLAFGIAFLALARGLHTWNRWAWYVAVILYGLSAVGALAVLTEGDPTGYGGVIPLAIVWYLWKHRAEFSIRAETAAAGRPAAEAAPRPRGTAPVDGAPYQPPPEDRPASSPTPQDTAYLVFNTHIDQNLQRLIGKYGIPLDDVRASPGQPETTGQKSRSAKSHESAGQTATVTCASCGQWLRVPSNRGRLVVTCPGCGNRFAYVPQEQA